MPSLEIFSFNRFGFYHVNIIHRETEKDEENVLFSDVFHYTAQTDIGNDVFISTKHHQFLKKMYNSNTKCEEM